MTDSLQQLFDGALAHQRETQVDADWPRLQLAQPSLLVVTGNHRHFTAGLNAALPQGQVKPHRLLVTGHEQTRGTRRSLQQLIHQLQRGPVCSTESPNGSVAPGWQGCPKRDKVNVLNRSLCLERMSALNEARMLWLIVEKCNPTVTLPHKVLER